MAGGVTRTGGDFGFRRGFEKRAVIGHPERGTRPSKKIHYRKGAAMRGRWVRERIWKKRKKGISPVASNCNGSPWKGKKRLTGERGAPYFLVEKHDVERVRETGNGVRKNREGTKLRGPG